MSSFQQVARDLGLQRRTDVSLRIRQYSRRSDYYAVLEVSRSASREEISRAYHESARVVHPDKNRDEDTTEVFQLLAKAYEVLSDPEKRRAYDSGELRNDENEDDSDEEDLGGLAGLQLSSSGRPSDVFRRLFGEVGRSWKPPTASDSVSSAFVDSTIRERIQSCLEWFANEQRPSTGTSTPPGRQVASGHCLICEAVVPAGISMESHLTREHNAYRMRIASIREEVGTDSAAELLYPEDCLYSLPTKALFDKKELKSSYFANDRVLNLLRGLPAVLQSLDAVFLPFENDTSEESSNWLKFLDFNDNSNSGDPGLQSVVSALNPASLPMGIRNASPTSVFTPGSMVPITSPARSIELYGRELSAAIPSVKCQAVPSFASVVIYFNCCSCKKSSVSMFHSNCRRCGQVICRNCADSNTANYVEIPDRGLVGQRHLVCSPCLEANKALSQQVWMNTAASATSWEVLLLSVAMLRTHHPEAKLNWTDHYKKGPKGLFLSLGLSAEAYLNSRRSSRDELSRLWLTYSLVSLSKAIALELSGKSSSPLVLQCCFALRAARLFSRRPGHPVLDTTWASSFFEAGDDGATLLVWLLHFRDWSEVGMELFRQQDFKLALFALQIANAAFEPYRFLIRQASLDQHPAELKLFYAAGALLLQESPETVALFSKQLFKNSQFRWVCEILCATFEKWKDSPKAPTMHWLLIQSFEKCGEEKIALLAGCEHLIRLIDGDVLTDVMNKIKSWKDEMASNKSRNIQAERQLLEVCRCSPEVFAVVAARLFHDGAKEVLESFDHNNKERLTNVPDIRMLPDSEQFIVLFPRALLLLLEERTMEAIQILNGLLTNRYCLANEATMRCVCECLLDSEVRSSFLHEITSGISAVRSLRNFLSWPILSNALALSTEKGPFRFKDYLVSSTDLRALRKIEIAIDGVARGQGHLETAFCLIDLQQLCPNTHSLISVLFLACKHLLAAAMSSEQEISGESERQACLELTQLLLEICEFNFLDSICPSSKCHFLRQLLAIKAQFLDVAVKVPFLSTSSSRLCSKEQVLKGATSFEKSLKQFLQVSSGFPVFSTFNRRAFDDIIYGMQFGKLSSIGISLLEKKTSDELVPRLRWAFWKLEGAWSGWLQQVHDESGAPQSPALTRLTTSSEFLEEQRWYAMGEFLRDKKYSWQNASSNINCLNVPRTPEGFIAHNKTFALGPADGFSSFDGYRVNLETGKVEFLMTKSRIGGKLPLFGWKELREILTAGAPELVFSLDSIENDTKYHPFQLLHFMPENCRGTTALAVMFHTDYLLKFFSCGQEISCMPPFPQRSTESLLQRLPGHIRQALSVNSNDQADKSRTGVNKSIAHRFWIEAESLAHSSDSSGGVVTELYGKQTMCVKTHLLRRNSETGELEDATEEESYIGGTEKEFARNFTKYYDEIADKFPEFALLKEICKMLAATRSLLSLASGLKEIISDPKKKTEATTEESKRLRDIVAGIEFPLMGKLESILEGEMSRVARENSADWSRLSWSDKDSIRSRFRSQIESQLVEAESKIVSQVASSLELTDHTNIVRNMLVSKACNSVAILLVDRKFAKYNAVLDALRREGLPVDSDLSKYWKTLYSSGLACKPSREHDCSWVPAVFRKSVTEEGAVYRVYGGVHLSPSMQRQVVTPPSHSSYFMSTTALGAQRANGFVNSTAAKIDNMNAFNQKFWQNQAAVNQQMANSRVARNPNSFFNANPSLGQASSAFLPGARVIYVGSPKQVDRYWGGRAAADGAYYCSVNQYSNVREARNGLAVLPSWGCNMRYRSTTTIPAGTRIVIGHAAPQADGTGSYTGRGTQILIQDKATRAAMAASATTVETRKQWGCRMFG